MMKRPEALKKILDEWEFAALVGALMICLTALIVWLNAWLGKPEINQQFSGSGNPPIPSPRVNYDTAYAMLKTEPVPAPGAVTLFQSDIQFKRPVHSPPKHRTWIKRPKPVPKPTPKPTPKPVVTPVTKPKPVPPPAPKPDCFVYQGYRQTDTGEKAAVIRNETTGKTLYLRVGKNFLSLYVSDFTNNSITFIRPNGKPYTLKAGDKLRYYPHK